MGARSTAEPPYYRFAVESSFLARGLQGHPDIPEHVNASSALGAPVEDIIATELVTATVP